MELVTAPRAWRTVADMGFETRAGQRPAAATGTSAGPDQPAAASSQVPQEQLGQLSRTDALRRLDEAWGSLPPDALDWARDRLGVSAGPSAR